MTECNNCGKDIFKDNVTLYRMNPKGETPAIMWCEDCCKHNGVPLDKEIKNITDIIKNNHEVRNDNRSER